MQGNLIGKKPDGTTALGNGGDGTFEYCDFSNLNTGIQNDRTLCAREWNLPPKIGECQQIKRE